MVEKKGVENEEQKAAVKTAKPEAPAEMNGDAELSPEDQLARRLTLNTAKPVPDGEGGMTQIIKFREPTGADIERIGNPVVISVFEGNPKPSFDAPIMTAMMAHLANVPPSTIRKLTAKEWNTGAWKIMGFFTPDLMQ